MRKKSPKKMKFMRCLWRGFLKYGYLDGDTVVCVEENFLEEVKETGETFRTVEILEWLAPTVPSKILAIGLNYRAHAAEFNLPIPEEPVSFLKSVTSMTGHGYGIIYPKISKVVDFEAELAIVIGKKALFVSESEATDYIFGYTCGNDVSARDIQKRDGQWMLAKSLLTFTPLGPCVATGIDPSDLHITSRLNGKVKQDSRTSDMIFSVPYIVSFLSQAMPLLPGDVILTGTPSGVGHMKKGDKIEIEIENIGVLSNTVIPVV